MTTLNHLFGLYSSRILTESGFIDGTVLIKDGIISEVISGKLQDQNIPIEDLNDLVVMPGIIDSHVHINEPGRAGWEGFETITKAAIAGGITALVDMPLNATPVTTSKETLKVKIDATKGKLYCNVGFWGGIVPENIDLLDELVTSGVLGIKAFLTHSGIDDFPNVSITDLKKGLEILKKHQVPLLAHAELDEIHDDLLAFENNPTNYNAYLKSRPKEWEDNAIDMLIQLCEEYQTPIHIVHLSSANSLDKIREARAKGLPLTVETCPQYLYFNAEDIPNKNTLFKCAPPIREKENNEKLWEAIKDGTIDFIVTDHSPSTPELKEITSGNLKLAWGGISSIQFSLPVIWTKAKERGFSISDISSLMSTAISKFLRFDQSKGLIKEGYDADLVVWNPEQKFTVAKKDIHFRHKITPYEGEELTGVVKQTYVSGIKVFDQGEILASPVGEVMMNNKSS